MFQTREDQPGPHNVQHGHQDHGPDGRPDQEEEEKEEIFFLQKVFDHQVSSPQRQRGQRTRPRCRV